MRVYLETYGCTANKGDAELMLGQLAIAGHEIVSNLSDAEAIIVNTCAVKCATHRKMLKRLKNLRELNGKHVIVSGCLPLIDLNSIEQLGNFDCIVSCKSLQTIAEALECIKKGQKNVKLLESSPCEKPLMYKIRSSKVSAVVTISEGCVSNCSYCSVKFARGKLKSFKTESILDEIKTAVATGYREILITAQDTSAYGLDLGMSLPELLDSIVSIDGDFIVRVGMMNPATAKRILPELLESYESEKIYKFLHLPVQSGDDRILALMRREHTVEEFLQIVRAFRKKFEDLSLATDIIVGFPGEGEEEFIHTYELVKEIKPDKVNISRFSPMPNTEASKMLQVDGREIAKRSRRLNDLCKALGYKRNKSYIGRVVRALITEEGKRGGYVARLPNYKSAIVEGGKQGEFSFIKIFDARTTYLLGELADEKWC